jgi:hypothetical protein
MATSERAAVAGSVLLFGAAGAAAYQRFVRPWCVNWGAWPAEAVEALPGDELVAEPAGTTTRAVTIDAPPADVWPWIVQIGQGRAGAYTYDWIENLLGLDMHSANEILPEFQHPAVGDVLLRTPGAEMQVRVLEPERCMVAAAPDGNWSWAFVLVPLPDGRSRFISRNRWPLGSTSRRLGMLLMEPASLVMERKMLHGIKQRAERRLATPAERRDPVAAPLDRS